jgi:uncharacterized NAD(P)/FAD-binding protein YdhS
MHIAIIGGGFSGAACALHLLRDHPDLPLTLTIIEPRTTLGAGLAYSAPSSVHRINVAAARMSVLPEDPMHFHTWLRDQGDPARDPASAMPDGRLYPARLVFGRYVDHMLRAQVAISQRADFRHLTDQAVSMDSAQTSFRIVMAADPALLADAVVLAVSHSAPDTPSLLRGLPSLLPDPWDIAALAAIPPDARVLVIGTGLTASDVMAFLLAAGHRGQIDAVSRHGLLPRPRTDLPVQAEGDFTTQPEASATALLRRVRRAVATAREAGRPWENIIDALRQQSGAAWGTLDWTERRRLLRHLRTIWDVHRFQSAPQIDAALAGAQQSGALRIHAGHLLAVQHTPSGTDVTLRVRGANVTETVQADVVINCTGPGHRSVTASHPVLRQLAERGDLLPDPAQLGIWVDGESRVLRADGTAWRNLFVAGPLARGTFGELMGLPQVNLQPRAVAASLASLSSARSAAA